MGNVKECRLNLRHANANTRNDDTMYIIMCVFTYTCSQKHNNLSDSITM